MRNMRTWFLLAIALLFSAAAAFGGIEIKRDGDKVASVTLDTGAGKLAMVRKMWSNTTLITASGKQLGVTDPVMYGSSGKTATNAPFGGHIGGATSSTYTAPPLTKTCFMCPMMAGPP